MDTLSFHHASDHFPLHTPEEFAELLTSLRSHGYDPTHPLVLYEGAILDGRNRYRACLELGLTPPTIDYVGNPYEKAWLENGSRRDLHAGQKAAIRLTLNLASVEWHAAQIARQVEANAARSVAAASQPRIALPDGRIGFSGAVHSCTAPEILSHKVSESQRARIILAKESGVSRATAGSTLALATKAPALLGQVAAGKLSLQDAIREANRLQIKARVGDDWTPFELERRHWVEDLGYPTLANYHRDPHLLEWGKATGRHVFIGRGSPWGNPFELGKDGARDYILESFSLFYFPRKPSLLKALATLDGKVLECYCVPEHCHGEVYVETLNRAAWELLASFLAQGDAIP